MNRKSAMIASVLVIVIQLLPVVLLIYWGATNNKISEYYLWLRSIFHFKRQKGAKNKEFKTKKEPPDRIVPRRPSLEVRLEDL